MRQGKALLSPGVLVSCWPAAPLYCLTCPAPGAAGEGAAVTWCAGELLACRSPVLSDVSRSRCGRGRRCCRRGGARRRPLHWASVCYSRCRSDCVGRRPHTAASSSITMRRTTPWPAAVCPTASVSISGSVSNSISEYQHRVSNSISEYQQQHQ